MANTEKVFSPDEMQTIYRALMLSYCLFHKWEKDERGEKIPHVEHIGDIRGSRQQVRDLLESLHETEPYFFENLQAFFRDVERGT